MYYFAETGAHNGSSRFQFASPYLKRKIRQIDRIFDMFNEKKHFHIIRNIGAVVVVVMIVW